MEGNYYAAIAEQLDRWYAYFWNPKNVPWIPQEWRQYMQTWFAPRELRRSLMEAWKVQCAYICHDIIVQMCTTHADG